MTVIRFLIGGVILAALAGAAITHAVGAGSETEARGEAEVRQALTVPILMYHRVQELPGEDAATLRMSVTPAEFEAQLNWLAERGYRTITMEQLADALDGRSTLPERCVALTFDDGWSCASRVVLPMLERRGMTATFFVYPGAMTDTHGGRFMTWEEVRGLRSRGMCVGSHTLTHPHLTGLDAAVARREIAESKRVLEERLGGPVRALAYPYGEFTAEHERMAAEAGYRLAVGVEAGVRHTADERLRLDRIPVVFGESLEQFAATMRGEDVPGVTSPPRSRASGVSER